MPWCPLCKTEYREGFENCSDCGSDLVEKLEVKEEKEEYDHEVYLINAKDTVEAGMIETLLNSNEIPVIKKHREAGSYMSVYMGNSVFGIDIYVPSKLYDKAREILEETTASEEKGNSKDTELVAIGKEYQRMRMIRAWLIILFLTPGVLWLVIIAIKTMNNLLK